MALLCMKWHTQYINSLGKISEEPLEIRQRGYNIYQTIKKYKYHKYNVNDVFSQTKYFAIFPMDDMFIGWKNDLPV